MQTLQCYTLINMTRQYTKTVGGYVLHIHTLYIPKFMCEYFIPSLQ